MNIGECVDLVSNTSCLTLQMIMTVDRLTLNERHCIYEFSLALIGTLMWPWLGSNDVSSCKLPALDSRLQGVYFKSLM